jgi:predicted PurR-regulated permease PerM
MAAARNSPFPCAIEILSFLLVTGALLLALPLHLLPALLAGFAIYELVQLMAPGLKIARIEGKPAAVAILALTIVFLLTFAGVGIVAFMRSEAGSLPTLLQKMADIIESGRAVLPESVIEQLPADEIELRQAVVAWLRAHAGELQHVGAEAGRILAHILIGLVIGVLVALYDVKHAENLGPLGTALQSRTIRVGKAFRRVVFAQARISALNTLLTALYLVIALPVFGVHLPLAKTMLAVTFVVGLLPVIGNLVSNTVIVILSLSVSFSVAIASLVFLVVIHKLEYFLNAHLVGAQVRAHAWELLLAMLVMEAAFGIPGLIAAPIYYAYIKDELVSWKLI